MSAHSNPGKILPGRFSRLPYHLIAIPTERLHQVQHVDQSKEICQQMRLKEPLLVMVLQLEVALSAHHSEYVTIFCTGITFSSKVYRKYAYYALYSFLHWKDQWCTYMYDDHCIEYVGTPLKNETSTQSVTAWVNSFIDCRVACLQEDLRGLGGENHCGFSSEIVPLHSFPFCLRNEKSFC